MIEAGAEVGVVTEVVLEEDLVARPAQHISVLRTLRFARSNSEPASEAACPGATWSQQIIETKM